ncbi:uncharacterized protein MYCFIDRAFT_41377 [Pseudocercospora fijiensis CIRAD86]|uniref:NAD(P)-binding domain-containing protein n=1 Tax=Pseudocercospora fijiensis (strain CIRAD86) TaxID=383855 RepID=M3AJR8_PSEFD|nr:uncharacterized protein MYCFIDRAFT_41377 [Pseudocercospora fijiensis CIRAD86]EME84801.1 hypothetical protein MYCFIDRAFT_41377 [Pseudocercospora fijiensis CIRAD86]
MPRLCLAFFLAINVSFLFGSTIASLDAASKWSKSLSSGVLEVSFIFFLILDPSLSSFHPTSGLAREVTDTLLATKKHEILLLSRQDAPDTPQPPSTKWIKVDYSNVDDLANTLKGIHTLLSFLTPQTDENNLVQKNLIDAAVKAGAKRFAPSEWVGSGLQHMEWYWGKQAIRDYLAEINHDQKVLEFSLFQPGWFTDYFAYPMQSAKSFRSFPVCISFEHCRAFYAEGSESARITLTTVSDFAKIVAQAVGYEEGPWPEIGGIKGTEMTVKEFLDVGERVRGRKFTIEKLKRSDLENHNVFCSWIPEVEHNKGIGDCEKNLADKLNASVLLSIADEDLNVGDEWNRILPGYEFVDAENFLNEIWNGK